MDKLEIKASFGVDDAGTITGTAWPFGTADRVGDVIEKGAFASPERLPMLFAHDQAQAIGIWDTISEGSDGLTVKGRLLIDDVARAREVRALVREGAVTGLSIGFVTKKATARHGGGRTITALDLHEISIVPVPSHPGAQIVSAKAIPAMKGEGQMANESTAAAPDYAALETKMSELSESLKGIGKVNERVDKLEAKLNRPAPANDNADGAVLERKAMADLARTGAPIEVKTMSVGSDPDGGYVVLPTVEGTIRQIARDYSPIRDLASSVTISKGDTYEVVLDMDEVGATWVGETAARPATSTPTLKVASIPVHEIYAMPMITQKLLDDASFDLGAFLEGKIADKFARTEPSAFASGDGIGKPRGFLTYATDPAKDFTRAWGKFQHLAAGSATPTDKQLADGLVAVATTLRSPYRANSTWLMSGDTLLRIRQIKDTTDHYIWQPGLQAGQPDRLLGYPVAICEDMPAIGSGTTPVALASWKAAYQIVNRHGLRLLRDPFTAKPHTLFYAYKRVGGDVVDFNALKFLKISNS